MGRRRDRLDKRLANQTLTRRRNSLRKEAERLRRNAKMQLILKSSNSEGPFSTAVSNWIGQQLGIKGSRIQPEHVKQLLTRA